MTTAKLEPHELREMPGIIARWIAAGRIIIRRWEPSGARIYRNQQSAYMAARRARFVAQGLTTMGQPRKRKPKAP